MKKPGKAYYMISAVAQKYNIHPQTLRLYEREGLLKPSRTEGNTRLYSEEDLEQLETILTLTRDLGVNLAGVEIILNMRRKIEQMQGEVNEFMDYVSASSRAASTTGSSVSAPRSSSRRRRISYVARRLFRLTPKQKNQRSKTQSSTMRSWRVRSAMTRDGRRSRLTVSRGSRAATAGINAASSRC